MIRARKRASRLVMRLAVAFGVFFPLGVSANAQDADCPIPSGMSSQHAAFLKQMIAKGDGDAGMILGALYSEGVSGTIPKDSAKSFACYRWAADRGNAMGQMEMGEAYLKGQFVPKDVAKAVEWTRKSADQNLSYGQVLMAKLYENGIGVDVDKVEALKWYQLAEKPRNGKSSGISKDDHYAARQLEVSMTPEEIAAANERAAAFVPMKKTP